MKITLIKRIDGVLSPASEQDIAYIESLKCGQGVTAEIKRTRNVQFHRKLFALLNYAYDSWEPESQEYKGQLVQKNFDRFRADITIMAGFYTSAVNLNGDVRLTPKSISFANMEQQDFDQLYNSIITVILSKVLCNYTRNDLDAVVDNIMGYA